MQLTAEHRQSHYPSFSKLPPRSSTSRRQTLPPIQVVLSIAAAAILCGMRGFTVKGNQKHLWQDIALHFDSCQRKPDFVTMDGADHGRIETRKIWVTSNLNEYLNFPHVGQAFVVERTTVYKKSGKCGGELAHGITSKTKDQATPARVLQDNRGHWTIENSCHYIIDWNYDEDRSRIRKGQAPDNISRLRRFAIGIIKAKNVRSVAQKMRELTLNTRLVFDYLRMTRNTCVAAQH
ncbi:MAG: ISAs1 family transposase [Methylococcaceae bacterium]|nr:ISAs1 family transposase [Methylococcaceae bacterium]MCI0667541.1 ISAs1 family transposase [Methylococcaceae bacterium]